MKNTLNYQGNKKSLLSFIAEYMDPLLIEGKYLLDIFSGSGSVSLAYASKTSVAYNDLEPYSINLISSKLMIAKHGKSALLGELETLKKYYWENQRFLKGKLAYYLDLEKSFLNKQDLNTFGLLKNSYPTVWNDLESDIVGSELTAAVLGKRLDDFYCLFSTYYANSYFGIAQCIDIDSLRYAIQKTNGVFTPVFFAALYRAMDECVFSKDGHMAQPLSVEKYPARAVRKKSIDFAKVFFDYLDSLSPDSTFNHHYVGFNMDFEELITTDFFKEKVGCVYADPPYTDMQYSRYYHLLTTVTQYGYPEPTKGISGYTKGLYLNNRSQSKLSCRKSCLPSMAILMKKCCEYQINLVISFGYPVDEEKSKTDRYVMDVHEMIETAKKIFGENRVEVLTENYFHANNRNSEKKAVLEYLVLCKGASR